jgi:hypothetical protein
MAAPAGVSIGILIAAIFIFAAVVTLVVLVDEDLKDRKTKPSALTVGGPTQYDPPVPFPPYIAWPAERPAPYVIPSSPNHPRVAAMLGLVGEGSPGGGY